VLLHDGYFLSQLVLCHLGILLFVTYPVMAANDGRLRDFLRRLNFPPTFSARFPRRFPRRWANGLVANLGVFSQQIPVPLAIRPLVAAMRLAAELNQSCLSQHNQCGRRLAIPAR